MIKEYLYAEDEEKWSSFVNLTVEENRDYTPKQFRTKLNPERSQNSVNGRVSNESSCSLILSPNISFQDSEKAKEPFVFDKGYKLERKSEWVGFEG